MANNSSLLAFRTYVRKDVGVIGNVVTELAGARYLCFRRYQLLNDLGTLYHRLDFDMAAKMINGV